MVLVSMRVCTGRSEYNKVQWNPFKHTSCSSPCYGHGCVCGLPYAVCYQKKKSILKPQQHPDTRCSCLGMLLCLCVCHCDFVSVCLCVPLWFWSLRLSLPLPYRHPRQPTSPCLKRSCGSASVFLLSRFCCANQSVWRLYYHILRNW